jgi:hypothetical protein
MSGKFSEQVFEQETNLNSEVVTPKLVVKFLQKSSPTNVWGWHRVFHPLRFGKVHCQGPEST